MLPGMRVIRHQPNPETVTPQSLLRALVIGFLVGIIFWTSTGCAPEPQQVCVTGSEAEAMALAVEYWDSRGYSATIATDDCTVRTRVAEEPVPERTWAKGQCSWHELPADGTYPTHTIQSEVRMRESCWSTYSDEMQAYYATYELGRIWWRRPQPWAPMRPIGPTEKQAGEFYRSAWVNNRLQTRSGHRTQDR